MATVDTLSQLKAEMQKRINQSLNGNVRTIVKKCVQDHAQNDVLATYEPKEYKRRSTLGIDSSRNIVGEVKDNTLTVSDVAQIAPPIVDGYTPSGDPDNGLPQLIEQGAHNLFHEPAGTPYIEPRPFMTNAKKEVATPGAKAHEDILKAIKDKFPDN